ncbi:MAG: hypothetical protein FJ035_09145, partial [Chloroflexi bacterium]|nr:hypothetical protein [Chloroflexota bacterium]
AEGRPRIDLAHEARVQRLVLDAHARGLLAAAHDLADGGLSVAAVEMCLAGEVGLEAADALGARLPGRQPSPPGPLSLGRGEGVTEPNPPMRLDATLFGEGQSRFLVAVPGAQRLDVLEALAAAAGIECTMLGRCGGARFRLGPLDANLDALRAQYEGGLERALGV